LIIEHVYGAPKEFEDAAESLFVLPNAPPDNHDHETAAGEGGSTLK